MPDEAKAKAAAGRFGLFEQKTFTILWLATLVGNTGSFMRDVASSWVATDLSPSPAAIAMIQAAGSLPAFLLAIPAGVLSDILDRRKFLIFIQLLLAAVTAALMLLAGTGAMSLPALIGLSLIGGVGTALMGPTWMAITPELVPRNHLRSAIALNSLGVNISRSIGPAAGGMLLAAAGAAVTYGADLVSYAFVIGALIWWRRPSGGEDVLSERFFGAFRAGLRYARAQRELHVVLWRAAIFFAFSSALWALLPLVARRLIGADAGFFGLMMAAVGVGAIGGALLLPRLRRRLTTDMLMTAAAQISAAAMAVLAFGPPAAISLPALFCLGAAWITALTSLAGTAQSILPNWVRGRALAVYLTVFNGALAGGSLGWGSLAQIAGIPATLWIAAAGMAVSAFLLYPLKLPAGEADLMASHHWPEPLADEPPDHDRGPVTVLIEYRVARHDRPLFLEALARLSEERLRDGAYGWGVTEDLTDPTNIVEWFMVESWAEHLRQHRRVSNADRALQDAVHRFHQGPEAPKVRHLLALKGPRRLRRDKAARLGPTAGT